MVGVPCCVALTGVRHALRLLGLEHPEAPIHRICFFKLAEQGATVLAYDALVRACDMAGRENVFFCVFEKNREILDLLEVIPPENVIPIRDSGFPAFALDTARALVRLRRLNIDAAIDMELFARITAMLCFLSGAKRRVGLHHFAMEGVHRGNLFTHRMHYNPYLHMRNLYDLEVRAVARAPQETPAGKVSLPELPPFPFRFEPRGEEVARVRGLLAERGVDLERQKLVIMNPKCGDMVPIRKWPDERYSEVGRRLLAEYGDVAVAVTGLESERDAVDALCRGMDSGRAVSLAGALTLRELIVLLSLGDVLFTSDSGPAHFAAMTEIDIVVLFGPETPRLYGPVSPRTRVVCKELGCSPCVNALNHRESNCPDNQCMKLIEVEDALDAIRQCLQARGAG